MKFFICLTVLIKFIGAANLPTDSYLQLDVSSNPVLPGLTKTLTMTCRIRVKSPGAAPNLAGTTDALKLSGSPTPEAADPTYETTTTYLSSTPVPAFSTPEANTSRTLATESTTVTLQTTTTATSKPLSNVTSSPADVSHLMSIVITKRTSSGEDVTVAEVTPYDAAGAEDTYVDVLQVNGSVFHTQLNGELGYLTLTWRTPQDDQVGKYTCEASALSHLGHVVSLTGSLEILARRPGINDIVPLIVDLEERIYRLELENQELKHRLDLLKA